MKKVLIVEDEAMLREAYEDLLMASGYDVRTAMNGHEALQVVLDFCPDVILLDIIMPRMDGLAFLEAAELRTVLPKAKVFVLSNLLDQHKLAGMLKQGASGLLLKSSLTPRDLLATVSRVC